MSSPFEESNLVAKLGKGRFSEVLCYRNEDLALSCEYVAVKRFRRTDSARRSDRIMNEKEVLRRLCSQDSKSSYIINLLKTVKDDQDLYFVYEPLLGGSLSDHIRASRGLSIFVSRSITAEMVSALIYLKKHDCVHRDIKANNILLNEYGHVVLCDFGSAKVLPAPKHIDQKCTESESAKEEPAIELDVLGNIIVKTKPNNHNNNVSTTDSYKSFASQRTYTFTGTPHCLAPEMLLCAPSSSSPSDEDVLDQHFEAKNKNGLSSESKSDSKSETKSDNRNNNNNNNKQTRSGHSFGVDWWALGILLYEMLSGSLPLWRHRSITINGGVGNKDSKGTINGGMGNKDSKGSKEIQDSKDSKDGREDREGDGSWSVPEDVRSHTYDVLRNGLEAETESHPLAGCWSLQHTSSPSISAIDIVSTKESIEKSDEGNKCDGKGEEDNHNHNHNHIHIHNHNHENLAVQALSLLAGLLEPREERRLMLHEVETHPFFQSINCTNTNTNADDRSVTTKTVTKTVSVIVKAVRWTDVHTHVSTSPYPDFDQRIGFLDLIDLASSSSAEGGGDDLTEEQQALFAGF